MKKILFVLCLGLVLVGCKKQGCTDPLATNYNEKATADDGTCAYQSILDQELIGIWKNSGYSHRYYLVFFSNGIFDFSYSDGDVWISGSWFVEDNFINLGGNYLYMYNVSGNTLTLDEPDGSPFLTYTKQ